MRKDVATRVEMKMALFAFALFLALRLIPAIPEYVLGSLAGLGLAFMAVGILPTAAYDALKRGKRKLLGKIRCSHGH